VADDRFDLNRDVGSEDAVILHDERIHSGHARHHNRNSVAAFDQRPPCSLTTGAVRRGRRGAVGAFEGME
jgi:hypothetical protein